MSVFFNGMVCLGLVAVGTTLAAPTAPASGAEFYPLTEMPNSKSLPFSEAVRVGNMLYLSGTVGVEKSGKLAPGGMAAEAKQAMDNIGATLARHGTSFDKVVQCTVVLADMKDWPAFNEVYRSYFSGQFPARMAFAAAGLALSARVEVQCNAMIGGG